MEYTSLISGLIGGGIVALIQYVLGKKKELYFNLNKINEEKYRTILIHMSCALDYENRKYFSIQKDYEAPDKEYYFNCVKEYYYQSLLYSPDFVISELKKFIEEPSKKNYIKTAKAMRQDLWEKKSKLKYEDILIN